LEPDKGDRLSDGILLSLSGEKANELLFPVLLAFDVLAEFVLFGPEVVTDTVGTVTLDGVVTLLFRFTALFLKLRCDLRGEVAS
jgi:hypothetical protein